MCGSRIREYLSERKARLVNYKIYSLVVVGQLHLKTYALEAWSHWISNGKKEMKKGLPETEATKIKCNINETASNPCTWTCSSIDLFATIFMLFLFRMQCNGRRTMKAIDLQLLQFI